MNRRHLVATLSGLITARYVSALQATPFTGSANNLSLIRLIANPNSFDGHRLRLAGYLANNGLDRAVGLYVSELDGRNFIASNSVDLHLEDEAAKKYKNKYVILNGIYHSPKGKDS